MSPCHLSLCPHHLSFDLFRPSHYRLLHPFFNSLPISSNRGERPPPPEECHFLCGCCHCSRPFFFHTISLTSNFCLFLFLLSPERKTRGGDRQTGMQRVGKMVHVLLFWALLYLVRRCFIPTSLAVWPDSPSVFWLYYPPLHVNWLILLIPLTIFSSLTIVST